MTRSKLCILVLIFTFVALSVSGVFLSADALEVDKYLEADISLSCGSVYGQGTYAEVVFWSSLDNMEWTRADDFDKNWCDLVYYDSLGVKLGTNAPTELGKYTVKAIVNSNYSANNYFLGIEKITVGTELSSYNYEIVSENFAVLYGICQSIDYSGLNCYSKAIDGTEVFASGVKLEKDVDYSIELYSVDNGISTVVDNATDHGLYRIAVTMKKEFPNAFVQIGDVFSGDFTIVNSLKDLVSLADTKKYEGRYPNSEALATDYYSVDFNGKITTDSIFNGKYDIKYVVDNAICVDAPRTVGDYIARFVFNTDIDSYGISVGDFIDLPYSIYSKPYTVSFINTAVSNDGYSIIYQGNPVLIAPEFNRDIDIISSETKYFRYIDDTNMTELPYGEYPTEIARYKVRFYIDISDGNIGGAGVFGASDAEYIIDSYNNIVEYDFQIIPKLNITFNSDYDTLGEGNCSILNYTNKRPEIVRAIKDSTMADIPSEYYSVTYYDLDWNATDAIESGEYRAVITFDIDNEEYTWTNGDTVITDGLKLYYNFIVLSVEPNVSYKIQEDSVSIDFGGSVETSDYTVSYFKKENGFNYQTALSDMLANLGDYTILVEVKNDYPQLGLFNGDMFILDYSNRPILSLDSITLSLDGAVYKNGEYFVDYDGNIYNVKPTFNGMTDSDISSLSYSFYYEMLDRHYAIDDIDAWSVCDYPIFPATYRAVLKFNADNSILGTSAGDELTYIFTVKPLALTAEFSVKQNAQTNDLVYDNDPNGKDFDVTFKSGKRPVNIDSSKYSLLYATVNDGIYSLFTPKNPINAGNYAIAVYFNYSLDNDYQKYGIYTDEPTITDKNELTRENLSSRSVFSPIITIEKLSLTVIVRIPVEEKAYYRLSGVEVSPEFVFYKTNGYDGSLPLTDDRKLSYISLNDFDSSLLSGGINSIVCDTAVDRAVLPAKYIRNLSVKDGLKNNIVIETVKYELLGTKSGVEYRSDMYYASKLSQHSFVTEYRITPLPLTINVLSLESNEANSFIEHYYGNTYAVDLDELDISALDESGNRYLLSDVYPSIDSALRNSMTISYHRRLSGTTQIVSEPISINGSYDLGHYLFSSGDYAIKVSFGEDDEDIYKYFTLADGKDGDGIVLSNCIESNAYVNIPFTVSSAKALNIVFDGEFNSFAYDGEIKSFDIYFLSGSKKVDLPYNVTLMRVLDGSESVIVGGVYPSSVGKYCIQIGFDSDIYEYKLSSNSSSVSIGNSGEYINSKTTAKYYYSITEPVVLDWRFSDGNKDIDALSGSNSYPYSDNGLDISVSFFDANDRDITVNLIKNVDYAIRYYSLTNGKYVSMSTRPTTIGEYAVELVFLRTLYDYRVLDGALPYGYSDASLVSGRFGLSLLDSNGVLTDTMFNEKRFIKLTVETSNALVSGVKVTDKVFDNKNEASIKVDHIIRCTDGGTLSTEKVQEIKALFNEIVAEYDTVAVGNVHVSLYVKVGDARIKLPQKSALSGDTTAYQYILAQLDELEQSNEIDIFKNKLFSIYSCYNVVFEDVYSNITKRSITVIPSSFTREFDPFYKDADNLTYTYSDELLSSLYQGENAFIGALARDGGENVNKVGSYRIILGSLSVTNEQITLSDGNAVLLSDCFEIALDNSNSFYAITRRAITVQVTDGLSKYYGEEDPKMVCAVESGSLIMGDSLKYDGANSPIRETKRAIDDIGSYAIDLSNIAVIDSTGADISSNYRITYIKQTFTINKKEIFITPIDCENAKYTDDFNVLYALNSEIKRYSIKADNNGLYKDYTFNAGFYLSGGFGLEQVVNTESTVFAKYKITLGNIRIKDDDGRDVTANYSISSRGTAYYTVIKTNVVLELADGVISKTYLSPDPIIAVKEIEEYPLPDGYSLRADSSAVRAEGESVGIYKIELRNSSRIYIIEDKSGKVVTEYFNVIIRNNVTAEHPNGTEFVIEKFVLHVSVKEKTYVKNGSTIIGELVFRDSDGNTVPDEILNKLSVKFDTVILNNPKEGTNNIAPTYSAETEDENFEIVTEVSRLNVVFPENNITYKVIENGNEVKEDNAYLVVKAMLLKNEQMYVLTSDNGKQPTKEITVELPVDDALINTPIYAVAIRSDGSYELLNIEAGEGTIIVNDDEFNYIMICTLEVWPYYVIIVLVVLVIVAVLSIVLASTSRRKKRNGEKAVNFRKIVRDTSEVYKPVNTPEKAITNPNELSIDELDVDFDDIALLEIDEDDKGDINKE